MNDVFAWLKANGADVAGAGGVAGTTSIKWLVFISPYHLLSPGLSLIDFLGTSLNSLWIVRVKSLEDIHLVPSQKR